MQGAFLTCILGAEHCLSVCTQLTAKLSVLPAEGRDLCSPSTLQSCYRAPQLIPEMAQQIWLLYDSPVTANPTASSLDLQQETTKHHKGAWDWTELPCTVNETRRSPTLASPTSCRAGIPLSHPIPGWTQAGTARDPLQGSSSS